ncbi:histidine phosphatase family protein [Shewanella acanthi]|uniref:histidine phosphatase family protein n=1 Tax=Shewanella acanthi TaxID=2864212 RepID=UPI001C661381|nr:histidine phosphatase family protein [Shewanella acanthi]QYJ78184.1 histidine phosphatase family protein [Shewanella acanthi]
MKRVRLLLLRHGECEGGAILRGRTDVSLTKNGWQQMAAAVAKHSEFAIDTCHAIYSSPLRRCADFAKQFKDKLSLVDGLKEADFGDWDGQSFDALYQECGDMLDAYWQNPWAIAPPNGESMAQFEARVDAAIDSILDNVFENSFMALTQSKQANESQLAAQMQSEHIWVITHGGVIRHLMARALGAVRVAGFYRQLSLPYGALVTIEVLQEANGTRYWQLEWPTSST